MRRRVFAFALLTGLAASIVLLLLVYGSPGAAIASLGTRNGAATFAFLLVVAVLPASLPMTLVGAYLARRATSRPEAPRSLAFWLARGCGLGFGLGALGAALWFGGINASSWWVGRTIPEVIGPGGWELLAVVLWMALVGGAAGACVGAAAGAELLESRSNRVRRSCG